jgi:YD repeat-containing protein
VTYTYDAANPWRLTKISSSDGRTLNVAYNTSGRIASVTDGTRTWTYVYGTTFQVNLPDGTKWTYSGMPVAARIEPEADSNIIDFCARSGGNAVQPIYTATITHPSGAIGTFRFQSRLHGRSYVNNVCVKPVNSNAGHAKFPYLFDAIGLIDKTITGFGIPANTKWTYTYGATNQSWLQNCPNDSCTGTKTSEVTGPEGWTRYTFSNRWQHSEGKLLKVEQGSSPTNILRTESTTYLMDPTSQRYPLVIGINPNDRGDSTTEVLLPVVKRQILQQVRLFTWQIGAVGGVYDFDSFGRPTKITRSSAPSP